MFLWRLYHYNLSELRLPMAPPYLGLNAEPLIEEHTRSMTGSIRILSVRPSQICIGPDRRGAFQRGSLARRTRRGSLMPHGGSTYKFTDQTASVCLQVHVERRSSSPLRIVRGMQSRMRIKFHGYRLSGMVTILESVLLRATDMSLLSPSLLFLFHSLTVLRG